ncbi:hypothetical protein P8452_40919 [Trifolium repens]|nr:hypothetical protein P8452_40919 [Trifolium repens]
MELTKENERILITNPNFWLNLTRRNTPPLFAGETRSGFFRLRLSKPSACDLTCAGTTTAAPPPLALVARKASTTTTGTTPLATDSKKKSVGSLICKDLVPCCIWFFGCE